MSTVYRYLQIRSILYSIYDWKESEGIEARYNIRLANKAHAERASFFVHLKDNYTMFIADGGRLG